MKLRYGDDYESDMSEDSMAKYMEDEPIQTKAGVIGWHELAPLVTDAIKAKKKIVRKLSKVDQYQLDIET